MNLNIATVTEASDLTLISLSFLNCKMGLTISTLIRLYGLS